MQRPPKKQISRYEVLDAPDTKQSLHNGVLQKQRRRMRRQRRLAIEERRRRRALSEDSDSKIAQQKCVNLDGTKYCADGGDPFAEQRKLQEAQRRNLHEYMEERGVSMVVPALSATHEPKKSKKVTVAQVHKRRLRV